MRLVPVLAGLACVGLVVAGCTTSGTGSYVLPSASSSTPKHVSASAATHRPARPAASQHPRRQPHRQVSRRTNRRVIRTAQLFAAPHGSVRTVTITSSTGFDPRPALVYLPPAALRRGAHGLPVLELFHGTPGAPDNWFDQGKLQATADAFAAAHGGRAPVIVAPDINGSEDADTECIRTSSGADVETYLAVDIPRYVRAHFPISTNPRNWAIAGLSEGGMCALMIALRHYPEFRAIGDMSGTLRPTVGGTESQTVRTLFGGSQAAYDQHDPTWLLARHRYPGLAAWFVVGDQDTNGLRDQQTASADARTAGIAVRTETLPGGHHWSVWAAALPDFLAWVWPLID